MSQTATNRHNRARGWDARPDGVAMIVNGDGLVRRSTAVEQQASLISQALAGRGVPVLRPDEVLTLLDRVEDRDRAMLAMLLEHEHPDDIAHALGISASALKRRRAQVRITTRAGSAAATQDSVLE
jgi:FixJ family two-component response regulator